MRHVAKSLPVPGVDNNASLHSLTGTFVITKALTDGCDMSGSGASTQMERLNDLMDGQTFPCPEGPGGGYSDLSDGTAVAVSDGAGKLLGTGQLSDGTQTGAGVKFTFSVNGLPQADFYKLQIANRGELPYSRSDLDAKQWHVSASLG